MEIDRTRYRGRPTEPREEREERCYDLLDRLGIAYFRVDHEHADTIEACREVEALLGCTICKNLFLCNRQQTAFYLLIMPGAKPFKTKYLSAQIGSSRLSFAGAADMERLLGVTPQPAGTDERHRPHRAPSRRPRSHGRALLRLPPLQKHLVSLPHHGGRARKADSGAPA